MSDMTIFGSGVGELDEVSRSTQRALDRIHEHGLLAAGKIEATAYAGHVGLREIGLFAVEEALVVERTPHAGPRAKAVGDTVAAAIIGIVARTGYQS